MYTSDREGVTALFPSLETYKSEHSETNFKKVCVELSAFCKSVYASTRSNSEREIYKQTLERLIAAVAQ